MDYSGIISVLQAIAAILAVRVFILLSVIGAFILGYGALGTTDNHSLWVLGIFSVFTILPLVWLDNNTRKK